MKEIEKPLKSINYKECVEEWDYNYMNIDLELNYDLFNAANYMDIIPLLELSSSRIASILKGKTTQKIRETMNIRNDYMPEEEQHILEDNKWCMENL